MFAAIVVGVALVIARGARVSAGAGDRGRRCWWCWRLVLLGIVQSALSAIYSAALYRYATVGEAPAGFEGTAIATAFAPTR